MSNETKIDRVNITLPETATIPYLRLVKTNMYKVPQHKRVGHLVMIGMLVMDSLNSDDQKKLIEMMENGSYFYARNMMLELLGVEV